MAGTDERDARRQTAGAGHRRTPLAGAGAMKGATTVVTDPWSGLRRHTAARIALGRAGGSLPTWEVLAFAAAHAAARDAVHESVDWEKLEEALCSTGGNCI